MTSIGFDCLRDTLEGFHSRSIGLKLKDDTHEGQGFQELETSVVHVLENHEAASFLSI